MILLNGKTITPTIFPDNTSQVWKIDEDIVRESNTIEWRFENEGEFMHLAQLVHLLDVGFNVNYDLELPYLPYARQDKRVSNETTFAIQPFTDLLNTLGFSKISIRDAHSRYALNLIDNATSYFMTDTLGDLIPEYDSICFPDAGACDRYTKHFPNKEIITGSKVREQSTGHITEYTFEGNPDNKKILIIDDICDGGMTFRILAKELLSNGARQVDLYVSHGIFSKGKQVIHDDGITNIYTPEDSI